MIISVTGPRNIRFRSWIVNNLKRHVEQTILKPLFGSSSLRYDVKTRNYTLKKFLYIMRRKPVVV